MIAATGWAATALVSVVSSFILFSELWPEALAARNLIITLLTHSLYLWDGRFTGHIRSLVNMACNWVTMVTQFILSNNFHELKENHMLLMSVALLCIATGERK